MLRSSVSLGAAVALMLTFAPAARAGIADSPVPTLGGQEASDLYSVPAISRVARG